MQRPRHIAIDGPAGSGKSTVGEQLARRLDYLYIDTGAMYRAVAWLALRRGCRYRRWACPGQVSAACRDHHRPSPH